MRVRALLASVFVCLFFSFSAVAQTQQPSQASPVQVTRDAQALATLQAAVSALGGSPLSTASSTTGVIARGTVTEGEGGISGPILWENSGPEFRQESPGVTTPILFLSGHGNPALVQEGVVQRGVGQLAMVAFPLHLPAVALASILNNPNVIVSAQQSTSVDGTIAIVISVQDTTDSLTSVICKQTWYINPSTLLPFRVDYLASEASNALNTLPETTLFSGYQNQSGVLVPFQINTTINGQQVTAVQLTSIQFNATIPSTDFDPPQAAEVSNGSAQ